MRLAQTIPLAAIALFWLALAPDEVSGFGRGGGGGGRGGGGGGARPAGGGGAGARPAAQPVRPSPAPAPRPSPQPAARPAAQPSRPAAVSKPATLPSNGGSIAGPVGGSLAGKTDKPLSGAVSGGSVIGGKGATQLPSRPNIGQGGTGQGGIGQGGIGQGGNIGKGGLTPGGGGNVIGKGGNNTNIGKGNNVINNHPGDINLGNISKSGNVVGSGNFSGNRVNNGTVNVSRNTVVAQGNAVRAGYVHGNTFSGGWWGRYPNAWRAAAWTGAGAVFATATWALCSRWCGYAASAAPVYYDYGSSVVYQGDTVYVNGDPYATQQEFAQQATAIADTGRQAQATPENEWMPLGVFAMVQGQETSANMLFQLAVNKQGVIRGNFYNALSDTTQPVYGQVDPKTQRAAWTVGDKKDVVYEAGIANLTQEQTTMMVHFGPDRAQQWSLVRMQDQPKQ
jgi:hypothetical protein